MTLSPATSRRARARLAALALLVVAVLTGCKSQDEDEGPLISGAAKLCGTFDSDTHLSSCRFGFARKLFGDYVVSTLTTIRGENAGSSGTNAYVSADGVQWERKYGDGASSASGFFPEPPAFFEAGGKLIALARVPSSTPEGYQEVFTDHTGWTPATQKTFYWWGPAVFVGGKIVTLSQTYVLHPILGTSTLQRAWREFDPATFKITGESPPMLESEPKVRIVSWAPTRDADGNEALASVVLTEDQLCRVEASTGTGHAVTWDCVPREALPEGVEGKQVMRDGPFGPMLLLQSSTGSWAATVSRSPTADPQAPVREGVLRLADLGAKQVGAVLHIEHAAAILSSIWPVGEVSEGGVTHVERFVRVRPDLTLETVPIPRHPCTASAINSGLCRQVGVAEVAPMGDGTHLAVYYVSSGEGRSLVTLKVNVPEPGDSALPDAGVAAPDAGVAAPDAGVSTSDGGMDPADAGVPAPQDYSGEVRACAHGLACGWHGYPASNAPVSACAAELVGSMGTPVSILPGVGAGSLLQCGASGSSCESFTLCMNGGRGASYCAAHPGASCDRTTAVNCPAATEPASEALECNNSGNQCQIVGGRAQCLVAQDCPQAGACTSTMGYWKCLDSAAVQATAQRCPLRTSCVFSELAANPVCVGSTACSGANRCEGQVFVECLQVAEYGFERRTDCSFIRGHVCQESGCEPALSECSGGTDQCVGDVLQACILGQSVSYDCKANGFARCGPSAAGYASCLY